jgi:hypothetical protein
MTQIPDRPLPPEKPKKVPDQVRTAMMVMKEAGDSYADIAQVFGLNPMTVRAQIANVSEDNKRAVWQILSMRMMSYASQVAEKAARELLERSFALRDGKGRHVVTTSQLLKIMTNSAALVPTLANSAGMGDPESGGASLNPMAAWALTEKQISQALRGLPKGTRVAAESRVTVSRDDDQSGEEVSASFSSDSD